VWFAAPPLVFFLDIADKTGTDPELLIDALYGPSYFRWSQERAPVDKSFAEALVDKTIHAYTPSIAQLVWRSLKEFTYV